MKDKRIGKTVFPYVTVTASAWPHWKHPKGHLFNETQMDEMNAVDVEPPMVLKPFRVDWRNECWYIPHVMCLLNDFNGSVTISARLIDGEAVLVAEKVQP